MDCKMGARSLTVSISPPKPTLSLDEDRIFEAATDYKSWNFNIYTLTSLPAFDDSTSFGITVDDENSNIREEIRKLVQFVGSAKPPVFNSYGAVGRYRCGWLRRLVQYRRSDCVQSPDRRA